MKHGPSLMEVDWERKILNYTSSGCMLMELTGEAKLKHNYTSCGCMLMEVDWGGKLIVYSMVDWGTHETHPNGHNISKVDWGGHDSSSNHMNEFLFSEVDWGAHDSRFFLFQVNIDYDAKPKEYFIQGLWGELQQSISSTPPIEHMIDSLILDRLKMILLTPNQLILEWTTLNKLTGKSIQPYLTLVGQLQWLVTLGRLAIHSQVTTLPMFRSTPRKPQTTYGYVKKIIDFHWIKSKYYLSEMLSMHLDLIMILPMITKLPMTCGAITLFPRSAFMERPMLSK